MPPTSTQLTRYQDLPGFKLAITSLAPTTGTSIAVGSTLKVTFTLTKNDGSELALSEADYAGIYVSGPTTGYQGVISPLGDLNTSSVRNNDGTYTYTFAAPLPAVYPAQLNEGSGTLTAWDQTGKLTGQALLDGTYTVGLEGFKFYWVEGVPYADGGNAAQDFLLGPTATSLAPREVVKQENCANCHKDLRAHGGIRRDVRNCVLCHTAGAEDRNVSTVEGGSPGVTIDFGVMIHRIHDGSHLPSVVGVATNPDGSRSYAAVARPLRYVGFEDAVSDFSAVAFPVFPSFNVAMPQRTGYAALAAAAKTTEGLLRTGVIECAKCHGDPDGAGPLAAPAQGANQTAASRKYCGSCHDDVNWTQPYTQFGQTMSAQANDALCSLCHTATASTNLSVPVAHLHPLKAAATNPGINLAITSVVKAGTATTALNPGDKVTVSFGLTDDAGASVDPASTNAPLNSVFWVMSGPTTNQNLVMYTSIPLFMFPAGGAASYTMNLPMPIIQEFLGAVTGTTPRTFAATAYTPHWNPATTGGLRVPLTNVFVRAGAATAPSTIAASKVGQNYVDLAVTAASLGYAVNNTLVIDDGTANEEYRTIGAIDTLSPSRVWFTIPATSVANGLVGSTLSYAQTSGMRKAHAAGTAVGKATLTPKLYGTDYTVDNASGVISEVTDFGAGNKLIVSYTTDFVMPATYPNSPYDSLDITDAYGEWAGAPLSAGTYTLTMWGVRRVCITPARTPVAPAIGFATGTLSPSFNCAGFTGTGTVPATDNTSYSSTSRSATQDILVGGATVVTPYANISGSGATCYKCHDDIYLHGGGRRGFTTCIACHGNAGGELALGTSGTITSIKFAQFLHSLHKDTFPAMPQGVRNCEMCHGTATVWKDPPYPVHSNPAVQATLQPVRTYQFACFGCHSDPADVAHFSIMTSAKGVEACSVCHGVDPDTGQSKAFGIELMHRTR